MSLADLAAADASDGSSQSSGAPLSIAQLAAADAQVKHAPTQPFSYSPLGSDYENFAAGAGKAVHDLGQGTGQLIRSGMSYVPGGASVADKIGLPTQADVDESKRLDAPLMGTKAGIGGNIAGNLASAYVASRAAGIPAIVNPTSYGSAAASGAATGLLQPVATGDNRAQNVALGAASGMAGNFGANMIGRVAQPIANMLGPQQSKAVQTLQAAGVPLDAAQQTGSPALGAIRSSFNDNPFTRGAQQAAAGEQQAAYNRAILGTIGEHGETAATSDVMGRAQDRINGVFHDVLNRNNVTVGDSTVSKIGAIQKAANDEEKAPVSNIANRIVGMVKDDGTIPGQQLYGVKKDLDRLASSPDSTLAYHARQLRSTVMDAIDGSLSQEDQAAFRQARQQFGNMKKIEPAIDKEGAGNISPATLANVMGQKANRGASVYGNGDQTLVNLAQAGKQLLGDKMPNSGTAARAAMQLALPALAGAGGYYGADGDTGAGIRNALLAGGTMIAAPRLAQAAMNSPAVSGYLSQGMGGPLRNLLQLPQTNQLIGSSLRRLPGAALQAVPAIPTN